MVLEGNTQGQRVFDGDDGTIGGALEATHPGPHGNPGQGVGIASYLPTYLPTSPEMCKVLSGPKMSVRGSKNNYFGGSKSDFLMSFVKKRILFCKF